MWICEVVMHKDVVEVISAACRRWQQRLHVPFVCCLKAINEELQKEKSSYFNIAAWAYFCDEYFSFLHSESICEYCRNVCVLHDWKKKSCLHPGVANLYTHSFKKTFILKYFYLLLSVSERLCSCKTSCPPKVLHISDLINYPVSVGYS